MDEIHFDPPAMNDLGNEAMEADYQLFRAARRPDDGSALDILAHVDDEFVERESTPVPEDAVHINLKDNEAADMPAMEVKQKGIDVNSNALDVDHMQNNYNGISLLLRLQHVSHFCKPLKLKAMIALIHTVKKDFTDTRLYNDLFDQLEAYVKQNGSENVQLPVKDMAWLEKTTVANSQRLDALQTEYKRQRDEGVKESTRRAMEDLFAFHMKNNNPIEALKLYMRGIRDHCTQFKHMAEMWLNWMEASFVAKDWIRLDSVTSQAEKFFVEDHSTDEAAQKEQNRRYPPAAPTASNTQNLVRQVTQSGYTKTMIYTGLVRLHNDKYSQALDRFLAAKVEFIPSSWVVSHSDIALFITLCALATYSRKHIKTKILGNSAARKLLEAEPPLLEALQMFVTSQLGKCLDLLKVYKDKLLLDVFMWQATDKLFKQIRESFIIKYLQPYAVAYMAPMAEAIRVTPSELENELLRLCEKGLINVRIDALNGCVSKPMDNHKNEALENVNETYTQLANRCQSLILRTHIQQAHIAITMDRETRNKRKTNTASDDANENQPIRGRMMHGMMKAFRTSKNSAQQPSSPAHPNVAASSSAQNHSEADSSEGSDEPREPLS